MSYVFRAMCADDLPMVRQWLSRPHVKQWWPDGDDFDFVSGDLQHADLAQFLVMLGSVPFAYIQCYRLSEWDAAYGCQPAEARGLDQFIADAALLDQGHGSGFVRQFADWLFEQKMPRVLVDPDPNNLRAIRAYEKAGFTTVRAITTPDGPALMMERNP